MGDCQSKKKVEISDEIEEIEIDRNRDQGFMDHSQTMIRPITNEDRKSDNIHDSPTRTGCFRDESVRESMKVTNSKTNEKAKVNLRVNVEVGFFFLLT